jgi:hypothetical protein
MIGIDDLWGEDEEPKPKRAKPERKEPKKKEKPKKVKDTSAGFRMKLGTVRRRGKEGMQELPILIAKDPLCWILRIGSSQTYPVSLSSVFEAIAQNDGLELNGDTDVEDVIKETKAIEGRIREMGRILDERIRKYIVGKKKKPNGR